MVKDMIEKVSLKGLLAFFLVAVSAAMVFIWMKAPPSGDANSLALLAGFVTLFIKMAADAVGYQFNSSASSASKDDTISKAVAPPATSTARPSVTPTPPSP